MRLRPSGLCSGWLSPLRLDLAGSDLAGSDLAARPRWLGSWRLCSWWLGSWRLCSWWLGSWRLCSWWLGPRLGTGLSDPWLVGMGALAGPLCARTTLAGSAVLVQPGAVGSPAASPDRGRVAPFGAGAADVLPCAASALLAAASENRVPSAAGPATALAGCADAGRPGARSPRRRRGRSGPAGTSVASAGLTSGPPFLAAAFSPWAAICPLPAWAADMAGSGWAAAGMPAGMAAPATAGIAAWKPGRSRAARPKISWRKLMTTPISIRNASSATPIEITTSNRLPATTPVASSPIAMSTTDRTTPNRITLELRSTG